MNRDFGFGANGAPYEYVVAEAKSRTLLFKKIALIAAYVLWGVLVFLIGVATRLLVPVLALVPLSIWVFVFLTWRFVQVEYEYSFFSGTLTVSRILGGRTRRTLAKITIRDLSAVFPYEDANIARAEAYGAERTFFAASSISSPDLYIALWQDEESGKRSMLCFNANEQAIRILRYYNISAMTK